MTIPSLTYNQLSKSAIGQNWVVFQVKACRDAHVALSEMFNNVQTRTYEIIIGGNGNQNSFIRDDNTFGEVQRVDTPNIMDCDNFKTFWVKWGVMYRITVGEGALVDSRTFLNYVDVDRRSYEGFTVSTYYDITGVWDFSFIDGKLFVQKRKYCW